MAADNARPGTESALRAAELRRMRLLATGLLVLMLAVFAACTLAEPRWPWLGPWLGYVRAFAEAGMVGACADWFAVVALFRRPFGLPIPHTAIVPRNKERIGAALGSFICNNFLAPEVVDARLGSLDLAGRAAHWLAHPPNAATLARRLAGLLPPVLAALEEEDVRLFVRAAGRRGLETVQAAPLAARVVSVLVAGGHHQALFDRGVELAEAFLIQHEQAIRDKVAAHSYRWLPKWVDARLGDKVLSGLLDTLAELRQPDHPWRGEFQTALASAVEHLARDPDTLARGERIKAEVLGSPLVEDYLDSIWAEIKTRLGADLGAEDGVIRRGLERALMALGARLEDDFRMRAILNRWLRRAIERHVVPHRGEIGDFIEGVVARWDTRTLVGKLELQVGKDLQYIRINGTIVGGLVGLLIYLVTKGMG